MFRGRIQEVRGARVGNVNVWELRNIVRNLYLAISVNTAEVLHYIQRKDTGAMMRL